MSVNSSTYSDDSPLYLQPSSINLSFSFPLSCYMLMPGCVIFTTFTITNFLLLVPLCILVLYHGLQQWRQKCSLSTAAVTSPSDMFTYHMITLELIGVVGNIVCCCGIHRKDLQMLKLGLYIFSFTWYGATFFHLLTCVEHYLAVVHPIAYLSLRKERGIRIRNITIGCIWLLCIGGTSLGKIEIFSLIIGFCLLVISITITFFCSLSVLFVLVRSAPGKQGRDRGRVDQSKLRAFYTVVAILVVLFLRWAWSMAWGVLYILNGDINKCVWTVSENWINLPSSLVLPLLFLQRKGTLACCNNIKGK